MSWADHLVVEDDITAVQATDVLTEWRAATGGYQPVGATIIRTLLSVNVGAAGTVGVGTAVRFGLIVEAASGEAEVPDPVAEPFADWMYNSRLYVADGTNLSERHIQPMEVRSRRRMGELGETLWLVTSPELGGATNVDIRVHLRCLIALP